MRRLDFRLPNFTRVSWVSDAARALWQPRVERVVAAWREVEWRSVAAGIRPCALAIAAPEDVAGFVEGVTAAGLSASPLDRLTLTDCGYVTYGVAPRDGETYHQRLVVGAAAARREFERAWAGERQKDVGRLLGYPPCCVSRFETLWVNEGLLDTTWPMSCAGSIEDDRFERERDVTGPAVCNNLLRWLGIRAVPHLPCRFDCDASATLAEQLLALGREIGYTVEMDWLLAMLEWPVEWSALHGIAEIKTPLFKVATVTDATPDKYVVRRQGGSDPEAGATGLVFPFARPEKRRVTESRAFRRGMEHPIRDPSLRRPECLHLDNGFTSQRGMDRAHEPIVKLALRTLPHEGGRVLDLGCGNGALLQKIEQSGQGVSPFGLEFEREKVAYARDIMPRHAEQFTVGDIFACSEVWQRSEPYDLVILMLGRLLEVAAARSTWLKTHLRSSTRALLVYVYPGYPTTHGDLAQMATAAGIELIDPAPGAWLSLARP